MLPPSDKLKNDILALNPTTNPVQGMTNLVNAIANYMNQVQGGPLGTPGIFTLNNATMIGILSALVPVNDNSWVAVFASAFASASAAAVITPATVTNPAWSGSGGLDVATLPIGAATILTLPAAVTDLTNQLLTAKPDDSAPGIIAKAFHDATLDFTFNCIGLGPPPSEVPTPIPTSAL